MRIGRILSELHDRCARGEQIDQDQIAAQHPDIADELQGHFSTLRNLHRQDQTIEGLVRQGQLVPSSDPQYRAELGPYRIIEYLGRGGMGIVLKAYEPALRRFVALKLLRPEMTEDAVSLARFKREAQSAAGLHHPNVLTIYTVGDHDGVHFISMELIDGPTLADIVREQGPLPTEIIRSLMIQLFSGLSAAHAAGLIHRDIKSANLLIDGPTTSSPSDDGKDIQTLAVDPIARNTQAPRPNLHDVPTLKIADFGLARVLSSQTKLTLPQQSFGTPQYMSPEQARGEEDIDHRTDLYSAGVVLYEMLTGQVPFRSETPTAMIHQILSTDPPDPFSIRKDCDPALASIALRLLAKRREDRFGTAEEVLTVLQSGQRVTSYERRRRRVRTAALATLVIVALAGGAWLISPAALPMTAATGKDNAVMVKFGRKAEWETLHRYDETNPVMTAAAVRVGASGKSIVVAGTKQPPQPNATIEAFDGKGSSIWTVDLTSDRLWPDCDPTNSWTCIKLLAVDLDNRPGEEIIAVASNYAGLYPSRISIVDPESRAIRATLWHQGNIFIATPPEPPTFWLEPDFFGPGHPAIVAQGFNNKLDGLYEPHEDDPPPLTKWDIVPVVMIIDPRKMLEEGERLSPPATWRVPIPASRAIHAYAFLDLSTTELPTFKADRSKVLAQPRPEDVGSIERFSRWPDSAVDGTGPWFTVDLKAKFVEWGAMVTLDRNLNIIRFRELPHDPNPQPESYWRGKWKVMLPAGGGDRRP